MLGSASGSSVYQVTGVSPGATLQLGNSVNQFIANNNAIQNMNGTFDLNGTTLVVGGYGVQMTGTGAITNNNPSATATLALEDQNGQTQTINAITDGAGKMALYLEYGNAILTSTGNTFTGGTTISNTDNNNSITLQIGDGGSNLGSLPGNVNIGHAGGLSFDTPAGMTLAVPGNISGSGAGGLTVVKQTPGVLSSCPAATPTAAR